MVGSGMLGMLRMLKHSSSVPSTLGDVHWGQSPTWMPRRDFDSFFVFWRFCLWTHPENHCTVNFCGRLGFSLMLGMHYTSSLALNTNKSYSQTSNSFLSSSWYQSSPHCLLDSDISSAGNFTSSSNLFPYCNFVSVCFFLFFDVKAALWISRLTPSVWQSGSGNLTHEFKVNQNWRQNCKQTQSLEATSVETIQSDPPSTKPVYCFNYWTMLNLTMWNPVEPSGRRFKRHVFAVSAELIGWLQKKVPAMQYHTVQCSNILRSGTTHAEPVKFKWCETKAHTAESGLLDTVFKLHTSDQGTVLAIVELGWARLLASTSLHFFLQTESSIHTYYIVHTIKKKKGITET